MSQTAGQEDQCCSTIESGHVSRRARAVPIDFQSEANRRTYSARTVAAEPPT
jgi:hypothetical protein